MKLVVGLGNPGEKYAKVRHNLGFMVVEELGSKVKGIGVSWKQNDKLKSNIMKINYTLVLAKPNTYMNNSGMAVKLLSSAFSLRPSDIIIIHDDIDLKFGQIKVRMGDSAAGHHGVESIIEALGTDQFTRVRIGIGKGSDPEKFVLDAFEPSEKPKLKYAIAQAVQILIDNLEDSIVK